MPENYNVLIATINNVLTIGFLKMINVLSVDRIFINNEYIIYIFFWILQIYKILSKIIVTCLFIYIN